jgi:hypothetical protein
MTITDHIHNWQPKKIEKSAFSYLSSYTPVQTNQLGMFKEYGLSKIGMVNSYKSGLAMKVNVLSKDFQRNK